MLLSDDPPFLFFAMNKTGSTSVETALRPYDRRWARQWLRLRYEHRHPDVIFKHARPSDVRDLLGPARWEAYFTFCFVRNPFERLVSLYHYHRQRRPDRHPLATAVDFERWLELGGSGSARRSLADFVTAPDGTQVVDFVGRFETLEDDFAEVCRCLGITAALPRSNTSSHRHYSSYYTDTARRIVEERFGRDLERFDYAFESVG